MLPAELTNAIEQFIVYVHRNEVHFPYICVYHTNVFEADNIYKNPPPNVIFPKQNSIFFRSGTLLTAGALTDPHLPATASNVCTTDVRLCGVGRVPPKHKSWLRRCLCQIVYLPYLYRSYLHRLSGLPCHRFL